jgi:hypothetical protein
MATSCSSQKRYTDNEGNTRAVERVLFELYIPCVAGFCHHQQIVTWNHS